MDLESIVNDEIRLEHESSRFELGRVQVVCGDSQLPTATVTIIDKNTGIETTIGEYLVVVVVVVVVVVMTTPLVHP